MNLPSYKFITTLKTLPFVNELYLYGSRARGDNQTKSDIDLAIEFSGDYKNKQTIDDIIENADTLLKVDWVDMKKIGGEFKKIIMNDAVKL